MGEEGEGPGLSLLPSLKVRKGGSPEKDFHFSDGKRKLLTYIIKQSIPPRQGK